MVGELVLKNCENEVTAYACVLLIDCDHNLQKSVNFVPWQSSCWYYRGQSSITVWNTLFL